VTSYIAMTNCFIVITNRLRSPVFQFVAFIFGNVPVDSYLGFSIELSLHFALGNRQI